MRVSELIEILNVMDADAEVVAMYQPGWPFEAAVDGVISRDEIVEDVDGDDDDTHPAASLPDGARANDVFIVVGRQLRYGTKAAWGR